MPTLRFRQAVKDIQCPSAGMSASHSVSLLEKAVIELHKLPKKMGGSFIEHPDIYNSYKYGVINSKREELKEGLILARDADRMVVEGLLPDACSDYAVVLRTLLVSKGIAASVVEAVKADESHCFVNAYFGEHFITIDAHPQNPKDASKIEEYRIIIPSLKGWAYDEGKDFWSMGIRRITDLYSFFENRTGKKHTELRPVDSSIKLR